MIHTRNAALAEKMLKPLEEKLLIENWQNNNDHSAKERIIRAYMRSCYSFAARYSRNETDIQDLAQEGSIGIARALDKFDPSFNVKFSTYCFYWIENFIADAASKTINTVYVPSRAFLESRMKKLKGKKSVSVFNAVNKLVNLDAVVDEDGQTFSDIIPDNKPNAEELLIDTSLQDEYKRLITRAMSKLSQREQRVIFERKLLDPCRTLEEISIDLGITRERVRQIEQVALGKMSEILLKNKSDIF